MRRSAKRLVLENVNGEKHLASSHAATTRQHDGLNV